MTTASRHVLEIPAGDLYWAVLDTSPLAGTPLLAIRPGERRRRLGYLFENVLPIPVDELYVVYRDLADGHVLACGVERGRLGELRDAGAAAVIPESVPDELEINEVESADLNLLTGPFRSHAESRKGQATVRLSAAAVLVVAMLLTVGFERRTAQLRSVEHQYRSATMSIYDQVLGDADGATTQPPAVRLISELRRLRRSRTPAGAATGDSVHASAASDMATLLEAWPNGVDCRVGRLRVAESRVQLSAITTNQDEADALLTALNDSSDWLVVDQRIDTNRGREAGVTLSVSLSRRSTPVAMGETP